MFVEHLKEDHGQFGDVVKRLGDNLQKLTWARQDIDFRRSRTAGGA